ncbi:MAG: hypothetical protein HY235_04860 [Acidobacteria bacterium]|nr:hypothetical protein [Acidobacteriota bacterium]
MKRPSAPLFEKTSATVFVGLTDWPSVVEALGLVRLAPEELIRVAAVGTREDLPLLLESRQSGLGIKQISATADLNLFNCRRQFGRNRRRKVEGQFLVARTAVQYVYLLVAVAPSAFWRHGVSRLIDVCYPTVAVPFLTQSELHSTLRRAQKGAHPFGLRILELSSKKRLTTARKRFQSVREWTDAELDTVFRDAQERNEWFKSVTFGLIEHRNERWVSTEIRAALSKYGQFSCNGRIDLFNRTVISQIQEVAGKRLKFFADRERLHTRNHAAKPLQISYETEIFRSADQAKKLVEALGRFRHGTSTVLHGNPYVHLSVVDNLDYSSADVWVVAQDRILIVPQLTASAAGLKRIVNHIFEDFREGNLSEYQGQED